MPGLGVDLLDVSSGGNHEAQSIPPDLDYQTEIAAQIRRIVTEERLDLLIGAVGRITDAEQARDTLEGNTGGTSYIYPSEVDAPARTRPIADVVFIGRQFLKEPEWVLEAAWQLGVDVSWAAHFDWVGFRAFR